MKVVYRQVLKYLNNIENDKPAGYTIEGFVVHISSWNITICESGR